MYIIYHIYFHIIANIPKSKCVRKECVKWYEFGANRIDFYVHKTIIIIIVCLLNIASKVCDKVFFL